MKNEIPKPVVFGLIAVVAIIAIAVLAMQVAPGADSTKPLKDDYSMTPQEYQEKLAKEKGKEAPTDRPDRPGGN